MTLTQHAAQAVTPLVDWYINQLAAHGLEVVLAVQAAACIATWCGLGALLHAIDCHRAHRAEQRQTTEPDTPHIPTQPSHDDDLLARWDAWKATNTHTRKEDQP
ncbi:hypothetical protein [Streptomyces sp. NPDC055642]